METFSENDNNAEIEKGLGIQNQLRIWDSLLEIRIQLQKLLTGSNELPRFDLFENVTKAAGDKEDEGLQFMAAVQNSRTAIKNLMENLLGLQALLSPTNISESRKDGLEDEITSEEEEEVSKNSLKETVDSDVEDDNEDGDEDGNENDEDESDDQNISKLGNGMKTSRAEIKESDEENMSSDDHSDEDGEPVKRKKKRLNDYEQIVSKSFKASIPRRKEIIQKWNDKTQVASGKLNKNNFSAFQISTVKQIDHVLANKERLLKRTQMRNSQLDASKKEKVDEDIEDTLDPESFNDDDFFHQLLRELIENSSSNSEKTSDLSRHYLKLQKLRTKYKRKVDTKASKGRKIRYDIHPKLVNFMASYQDKNSMTENAKTELYKSIFKNLYDWKNDVE